MRALSICRSFTSAGQRTNKIIASLPWFTIQPYTQLIITHYSNITFIHIAQNCSSYRLLPWTFSPERVTLLSCCYENLADLSLSIRPILTHVTPNTVRCVAWNCLDRWHCRRSLGANRSSCHRRPLVTSPRLAWSPDSFGIRGPLHQPRGEHFHVLLVPWVGSCIKRTFIRNNVYYFS